CPPAGRRWATGIGSEQPRGRVVDPTHRGVVEDEALDAAVAREDAGLRLDLLRSEHPANGSEQGVAAQELEVARELFDAVDVAATLDLHSDGGAFGVASEDVDGADRRRELTTYEGMASTEQLDLLGEKGLQVRLDAILD